MKHFILFTLFLLAGITQASHTFFTPRQITTDPTFELGLTDYHIYHADDDNFQFSIKPFYQQSNCPDRLAEYFLPNCKACVQIRQDGTGDINPIWFNVIASRGNNYSSSFSLQPVRMTYGGVITLFARWKCLWTLINTTAMGATNKMHGLESNITNSGIIPGFPNFCSALNTCTWCAGRIPCCDAVTRGGVDDIQFKIGVDTFRTDSGHFAVYAVATAPTGKRPNSEYLFEPLVGSKHGSLGGGINWDYVIREFKHHRLTVLSDIKCRYVFKATERRSFDLCPNGDWSRYLQVVTAAQPGNSMPGINFFTRDVQVTPGATIDAWLAFHEEFYSTWDLEVGYTFWWRQKEHLRICNTSTLQSICCDNQIQGPVGIFNISNLCGGSPTTSSTATISQALSSIATDASFTPVTVSNFNLNSAANPTAFSNKIYAAAAWHRTYNSYEILTGLGGAYEFGNHAALDQWALWANVTIDI